MASLRSTASQHFSCEQEAALQTMLQSLLDGAVDEEEADQATAVQEVVCLHKQLLSVACVIRPLFADGVISTHVLLDMPMWSLIFR